jgi:hypothetical protein
MVMAVVTSDLENALVALVPYVTHIMQCWYGDTAVVTAITSLIFFLSALPDPQSHTLMCHLVL